LDKSDVEEDKDDKTKRGENGEISMEFEALFTVA
jgi:hypothetical protein